MCRIRGRRSALLPHSGMTEAAGIKAFAMKPLTKREIARTIRKVMDTLTSA